MASSGIIKMTIVGGPVTSNCPGIRAGVTGMHTVKVWVAGWG